MFAAVDKGCHSANNTIRGDAALICVRFAKQRLRVPY